MKVCNRCKIEKELSDFGIVKAKSKNYNPVVSSYCKECAREKAKIYNQNPDNKEKRRLYNKKYKQDNKDSILEYNRDWAMKNNEKYKETKKRLYNEYKKNEEYKSKRSEYHKSYRLENSDKLKEYHNNYIYNRKKTDKIFLLREYYKGMISNCFRKIVDKKSIKTNDIIGCSYIEFSEYIESKFEPWMNWENRGLYNGEPNYGWDIDHIIPLSSASCEDDLIKLNHYTNLQPLCSFTNRVIKRDNY